MRVTHRSGFGATIADKIGFPRRAFVSGLRYGEGRLYTKNAGDALRPAERDRARFALLPEPKPGGNALGMIRFWRRHDAFPAG